MKNRFKLIFTYLLLIHIIIGLLFKFIGPIITIIGISFINNTDIIFLILGILFTIILYFLGRLYFSRGYEKGFIQTKKDIIISIVSLSIIPTLLFFLFNTENENGSYYHFGLFGYIIIFSLFQFIYGKQKNI